MRHYTAFVFLTHQGDRDNCKCLGTAGGFFFAIKKRPRCEPSLKSYSPLIPTARNASTGIIIGGGRRSSHSGAVSDVKNVNVGICAGPTPRALGRYASGTPDCTFDAMTKAKRGNEHREIAG